MTLPSNKSLPQKLQTYQQFNKILEALQQQKNNTLKELMGGNKLRTEINEIVI